MAENKGHQNLKPIHDSQRAKELGAKGGSAKKGSKHLSTHIQEMLNDPDFELKLKNGEVLKGAPIQAIIKTAVAKAVSGDMRAFDMLAKHGYGEKLRLEIDDPRKEVLNKYLGDSDVGEAEEAESRSSENSA